MPIPSEIWNLTELGPWLFMGVGVFALFLYGRFGAIRRLLSILSRAAGSFGEEKLQASIADSTREWMPVGLTVIIVLSALYMILSRETYPDAQLKWAFGAVGTVLGYWFKG